MDGERYAATRLRSWREIADAEPGCDDATGREGEPPRLARSTALSLDLLGGTGELSLAADGTLRLRAAAGAVLPLPPESAVERSPWLPVAAVPREGANGSLTLSSSRCPLRLEVEREPFAVRLTDRSGAPLAELCELAFHEEGGVRATLAAEPGDGFFGLGDAPGTLDRRGRHLHLRNRDPQAATRRGGALVAIPFFLIHRPEAGCYGVLLDTFAPARCDMAADREDRVALEVASGGLDLLLFPGPLPRDVIARFTGRVGRASLPPLWALGHHELRPACSSERAVRGLGAAIRRRGIPTDALHLDVGRGLRGRSLAWNSGRFPAPRRLLEDLASTGLRVVGAVSTGLKVDPDWELYRNGCARDAFCKNDRGAIVTRRSRTALPDFNRPDVRAWWGESFGDFCAPGLAGICHNPAAPTRRWARLRGSRRALQADPAEPKRTVPQEQVGNLYGLQQSRATRAALESAGCERRPFLLTRTGTTGIQRYAAVSADPGARRWSALRQSIPALLNLSLSGVAFCGADIGGGFWPCTPELYARWSQLGALYPLARTHSGWLAHARQPWRSRRRAERAAHAAMSLRMRLLPYLYGLFREAEADGAPVWRPLFFEFPHDATSAAIDDQFMLGPALLAAPVLERGARERSVYLPPGTWISWHDDARYTGPRHLAVAAPLERIPLFVRAGSVLPLQSAVSHVGMRPAEPCILAVYPGADVSGVLVEDDGETTAYRGGISARTSLRLWSRAGGRLRLEIGRREGPFRLPERPLRVEIHGCPPPRAVYLDGARVAAGEGAPGWVACDGAVHVRLGDRGAGAALEIDPAP
ncbi:MAG TPA: TIM-barrel domain-containing protein [Myxococcota bacterium]